MGRLAQTLAISVGKFVAHQLCRSKCKPSETAARFVLEMQIQFCAIGKQVQTPKKIQDAPFTGTLKFQNNPYFVYYIWF